MWERILTLLLLWFFAVSCCFSVRFTEWSKNLLYMLTTTCYCNLSFSFWFVALLQHADVLPSYSAHGGLKHLLESCLLAFMIHISFISLSILTVWILNALSARHCIDLMNISMTHQSLIQNFTPAAKMTWSSWNQLEILLQNFKNSIHSLILKLSSSAWIFIIIMKLLSSHLQITMSTLELLNMSLLFRFMASCIIFTVCWNQMMTWHQDLLRFEFMILNMIMMYTVIKILSCFHQLWNCLAAHFIR